MSDNLPIRKRVITLTLAWAWDSLTIDTRGLLSASYMHALSNTCTDTDTHAPQSGAGRSHTVLPPGDYQ